MPNFIRYVPPSIQAKKEASEQTFAWMVAVKPKLGDWEGYTSWDDSLTCPQYTDAKGNITPTLTYLPSGAQVSNIPTQLKLGSQAADVKILAPRDDMKSAMELLSPIYLDRNKLLANYYAGAYWELFEIDPALPADRLLWTCGEVGNTSFDDLSATIELTTYEEAANRVVGQVLHVICQVPVFGAGGCRNQVLNDGPLRAAWSVQATVMAGSTAALLNVSFGGTSLAGSALPAAFSSRLTNGDCEFTLSGSGYNKGYTRPIRTASAISGGMAVIPKLSLPYPPQVGDTFVLVAGCRRFKSSCIEYANIANFRGQDLPGQDELVRRTRI